MAFCRPEDLATLSWGVPWFKMFMYILLRYGVFAAGGKTSKSVKIDNLVKVKVNLRLTYRALKIE